MNARLCALALAGGATLTSQDPFGRLFGIWSKLSGRDSRVPEERGNSMSWKAASTVSFVLALSLTLGHAATAVACSQRMGPYGSIYAAQTAAQFARAYGYQTSGVWGQGGIYSNWSNRRYFFNVFFPC